MRIAFLSEGVSGAAQPSIFEIIGLANLGYRSLVYVHVRDDTIDAPSWLQIKAAANSWRMEATQLEVGSILMREDEIAVVRKALEKLPQPVAAFCGSDVRQALFQAFPSRDNLQLRQGTLGATHDDHGLELLRLN